MIHITESTRVAHQEDDPSWLTIERLPKKTGEVVEVGPDVEFIKVGDICSVPFNISCGRCRNCKERKTGICLNVNPDRPASCPPGSMVP